MIKANKKNLSSLTLGSLLCHLIEKYWDHPGTGFARPFRKSFFFSPVAYRSLAFGGKARKTRLSSKDIRTKGDRLDEPPFGRASWINYLLSWRKIKLSTPFSLKEWVFIYLFELSRPSILFISILFQTEKKKKNFQPIFYLRWYQSWMIFPEFFELARRRLEIPCGSGAYVDGNDELFKCLLFHRCLSSRRALIHQSIHLDGWSLSFYSGHLSFRIRI